MLVLTSKVSEGVRIKDDVFLKVVLIQPEYVELAVAHREGDSNVHTLKVGEKLTLPHDAEVHLIRVGNESVRLGFETPGLADVQRISDH